jgi:hypothetical protein
MYITRMIPSPSSPTTSCRACAAPVSGRFCSNCGAPIEGAICAACGSALTSGAKFCHRCGTAVGSVPSRADARGLSAALPWAVAGIALVALIALVAGQRFNSRPAATVTGPPSALQSGVDGGATPSAGMPGAPDISALSPRERADRLYDRIMRLDTEGKTDSVQFFAPMAISAYQMLPELDADARYDLGRVAEVAGVPSLARAQADTILRENPTHLLGLILAARAARLARDDAAARRFEARVLSVAPKERRKSLPEYGRHEADIAAALAEARGRS